MAITPFMNLDLPTPTITLGPEWATDLNTALNLVDSHDHSTGKGIKVTPTGLNINSNLDFNQTDLVNANSYRMFENTSVLVGGSDLRCLYSVNGDLFYNNEAGADIQITTGTTLNASSIGGIGGDYGTSPAIVTYTLVNNTYTFDEDTNKRAKMDFGEFTIRETSATSANGITIKSPTSLSSAFTMTLLTALPASDKPLFVDNLGQWSTTGEIDTINIATDAITNDKMDDDAVDTAEIVDEAVTKAKQEINAITTDGTDPGVGGVSTQEGTDVNNTTTTFNDITNLTATITSTGRPIMIFLQPIDNDTVNPFCLSAITVGSVNGNAQLKLLRDAVELGVWNQELSGAGLSSSATSGRSPVCCLYMDTVVAGTYTYKFQIRTRFGGSASNAELENAEIVVHEL